MRTLVSFLVVLAGLYVLMALSHTWTPRLGLDLEGGTTITLTAKNSTGSGAVDQSSLELAKTIIQQRVDSLGVGESEVTTSGGNQIQVSVPNMQKDELVQLVGQTAQLEFRAVYQESSTASAAASDQATALPEVPVLSSPRPTAVTSPLPSSNTARKDLLTSQLAWVPSQADTEDFSAFTCGDAFPDVADQPLMACLRSDLAKTGQVKYLLGPTLIEGNLVTQAQAGVPQNQLNWAVDLSFNSLGADLFASATQYLATQTSPMNQFAIVLDGKVISAPSVSAAIPGGNAQITGSFTQKTAQDLANVLKYGALPLTFEVSSVDNVSATLGADQLRAGLIAGAIGLVLVLLYSILYYRALAIVVVASLSMAAAGTYALMVLLGSSMGFALSLPGIAGAIVAIGVTADSFVIFFERIRDEMREGRSIRTSVESGWHKARRTIVVADAVSLLSAIVLFVLAVGAVKGFAFTLGLTTILDLVIVFFFTKPLVALLVKTRFFGTGRPGSGLDAAHVGPVHENAAVVRRPVTARKQV
ncbi:MAG TPA: protein translocase subunit SecD [Propionibacteriaceae bacterium]|nr:protein translocase subunit SecD [Propionibacteriaceae bacterium]